MSMKNKTIFHYLLLGLTGVSLMNSCKKDAAVKFGEQYKKTLYIVHSDNTEYVKEHFFENENDTIALSVYCASSEPISSSVTVDLVKNLKVLDSLNYINSLSDANYVPKLLLESAWYNFESGKATIDAGKQYGVLKIPVHLKGIDVDKEYVLPISLVGNNAGYEINPKLSALVYRPKMKNRFSGDFTGTSKVLSEKSPNSIAPTVQAIDMNRVRLPIHNLEDDKDLLETNYMLLTIAEDGKGVSIQPYKNAKVFDEGESSYDPVLRQFTLNYSFMDGSTKKTVQSIIRDIAGLEE